MNILLCTSEYFPLIKTGGLADVSSALPKAWAEAKNKVYCVLPAYSKVLKSIKKYKSIGNIDTPFTTSSVEIILCEDFAPVNMLLVKAPIFENKNNPYLNEQGTDWNDNLQTFTLFSWVCANIAVMQKITKTKFHIVVSNDWQTGLLQAYLKDYLKDHSDCNIKGVHIIHNIAFPGIFPAIEYHQLKLPSEYFNVEGLEYYGQISFQKAAISFSDYVFTVSPNYAEEITNHHQFGMGFEGLLKHKNKLTGILNGVDYDQWHPTTDTYLSKNYDAKTIENKIVNKIDLQKTVGLQINENKLLIGVVSRLTTQKGFDIFVQSIEAYGMKQNIDFVILGTGESFITKALQQLAKENPNLKFIEDYNEGLSHKIIAGADALLIPSQFEPCGLTQLYAMAYGTIPLVHPTGGLKDSVRPFDVSKSSATGFYINQLQASTMSDFLDLVEQTFNNKKTWGKIVNNAMKQNFSWSKTQKEYLKVFKTL